MKNQNFKDTYFNKYPYIPHLGVLDEGALFKGGVIQMRAECVQGEGGGQKRPKNCVRTLCMAPKSKTGYCFA